MDASIVSFIGQLDKSEIYKDARALYYKSKRNNARKAELSSVTLSYLEFGADNTFPLIWAHGSCLTSYEILNVQEGLVAAGYRVIAIDYRGHGETEGDFTASNTSLYHVADDIAELMAYLGLQKAVVGGFSKGGWVAAAFYDTYPDKVLGLLLEDGGSFSHLRLKEELEQGVVRSGLKDFPVEAEQRLYHPDSYYKHRVDGVKVALELFAPVLRQYQAVEFIALLISLFKKNSSGNWTFHCKNNALMGEIDRSGNGIGYYSRLPIMQQSQELMLPLIIFRNLNIPLHIIDPVSSTTELPVAHQNKELADMHPDLVTHEKYLYDYSPHGAHLQRPDRFVSSAVQLLGNIRAVNYV